MYTDRLGYMLKMTFLDSVTLKISRTVFWTDCNTFSVYTLYGRESKNQPLQKVRIEHNSTESCSTGIFLLKCKVFGAVVIWLGGMSSVQAWWWVAVFLWL